MLQLILAHVLVSGCLPNWTIHYTVCCLYTQSVFEPGFLDTPLGSVNRDLTDFQCCFFVKKSLNPILCWQVSLLIAAKRCCRCHCNVVDSGSILNDKLCTGRRRKAPALWNLLYKQINVCWVYNQRARSCGGVTCSFYRKDLSRRADWIKGRGAGYTEGRQNQRHTRWTDTHKDVNRQILRQSLWINIIKNTLYTGRAETWRSGFAAKDGRRGEKLGYDCCWAGGWAGSKEGFNYALCRELQPWEGVCWGSCQKSKRPKDRQTF